MKKLIAIRHVSFEDLGSFERILIAQGYSITYVEAGKDDILSLVGFDPDLLIILGGPISANQEDLYPFLKEEYRLIEKRIRQGLPLIGICLGAQMIARVLGSRIYSAEEKEIGWMPIALTEEGRRSSMRFLDEEGVKVFHWHGETFDLPKDCERLASTALCKNQAFSKGPQLLGLQFHPEVIPAHLEQWYIGHACELSSDRESRIPILRKDASQWGDLLLKQGEKFLLDWLRGCEKN